MDESATRQGLHEAQERQGVQSWRDAILAANLLALGGRHLGGMMLKARAGGVRDEYLLRVRAIFDKHGAGVARPWVRAPVGIPMSRLVGGLDISAISASGRLVTQRGVLAAADGGVLVLAMAERIEPANAAVIAGAMDLGTCTNPYSIRSQNDPDPARFAVIAIDEAAGAEEAPPLALRDRLALNVDLHCVAWHHVDAVEDLTPPSGIQITNVEIDDATLGFLSAVCDATGKRSLRILRLVANASKGLAALAGRRDVGLEDAFTAVRICLGVNAAPQAENEPAQPEVEEQQAASSTPESRANDGSDSDDGEREQPPAQRQIDAMTEFVAAIENGAINGLPDFAAPSHGARSSAAAGKAGSMRRNARRGRPCGISQQAPFPDARPDLVATLRAAALWQVVRRRERSAVPAGNHDQRPCTIIRKSDFRYKRLQHAMRSTAIFVVDASGSTALERLGESKGAIEHLLSKCYVRRDEVAMIAFRGPKAKVILEPTRSLVLAKRLLGGLAGGGPTPLVSGLQAGLEMALAVSRSGATPLVVVMTDGGGNIAADGSADRPLAAEQLDAIARKYRASGFNSLCIDVSRRPREAVAALAQKMGAELQILRQANAQRMADFVDASMTRVRP